jgi:hypothetical protein
MSTTPVWVPLVVALIGIVGVGYTQRRADKRETEARVNAERRETGRWEREDDLRNYEASRDAYVSFHESLGDLARMIGECVQEVIPRRPPGVKPTESALDPLRDCIDRAARRLDNLALFASTAVHERARAAYEACWTWAGDARYFGQPDAEVNISGRAAYRDAEQKLRDAIRHDLGIDRPEASTEGTRPMRNGTLLAHARIDLEKT